MASDHDNRDGGCLAIVITVAVVLTITFWSLSVVGHLLGLTPTFSEVTDRPDGWVGRHYQGVVVGYVVTIVFIAMIVALAWFALQALAEDREQAIQARYWLSRVGGFGAVLVLAILAL